MRHSCATTENINMLADVSICSLSICAQIPLKIAVSFLCLFIRICSLISPSSKCGKTLSPSGTTSLSKHFDRPISPCFGYRLKIFVMIDV